MKSNVQWTFRVVCLATIFTALGYFAGVLLAPKVTEAQTCRPFPTQNVSGGICVDTTNWDPYDQWGTAVFQTTRYNYNFCPGPRVQKMTGTCRNWFRAGTDCGCWICIDT